MADLVIGRILYSLTMAVVLHLSPTLQLTYRWFMQYISLETFQISLVRKVNLATTKMALCVWGCLGLVVLQRLRNFCLLQSNILLKTQRWYCIVRRALDAWECWWWELGGGLFPESPALSLRPSSIHPHSGTHPRSHNHEKHRTKDTECNSDAFRGRKHRVELFSGPQVTEIFIVMFSRILSCNFK